MSLLDFIAGQLKLAQEAGALAPAVEPEVEAREILSMMLELSLGMLLEQMTVADAEIVLDAHLGRLAAKRQRRR